MQPKNNRSKILIIDDDPVFQIVAERDTKANRKQVIVPHTPDELDQVDLRDVGMVICDRHLCGRWAAVAENVLDTVYGSIPIVEMTADMGDNKRNQQTVRTYRKNIDNIGDIVGAWLRERKII